VRLLLLDGTHERTGSTRSSPAGALETIRTATAVTGERERRDDPIARALEPGEKIVWSDRPRSFARALKRRRPSLLATMLVRRAPDLLLLAVFRFASGNFTRVSTADWLTMTQVLGVGALPGALPRSRSTSSSLSARLDRLYAITDRGGVSSSCARSSSRTRSEASGHLNEGSGATTGDVNVGELVLLDVTYPARAVRAIRSVAP